MERDLTRRRRIGVVMQEAMLLDRSAFDNVATGLRFRHLPESEVRRRTTQWLEKLGISHLRSHPGHGLSGVRAPRVALARAFVLTPGLWLLDELSASLEMRARLALVEEPKHLLAETQTTTVFITHNPWEVQQLATRMGCCGMADGSTHRTRLSPRADSRPREPSCAGGGSRWRGVESGA